MNKRTKILLTLLSVATMTAAGAFGLAGCKKDAGNTTPTIQATYESYKAYAEANGQTALSYDDWLKVITAGAKDGADGEDGKPGKDGEDGATIDKIVLDGNGNLVITYTNPDMPASVIPLPEEVTHEHAYSGDLNDIQVLIPAKGVDDGLGYYKCQKEGCEHIELVIIRDYYKFTCVDKDSNDPISGVKVTVNGATAISDAKGVAKVTGFGLINNYAVGVEVEGFNVVGTYKTEGKKYDYDVKLAGKPADGYTPTGDEYCKEGYVIARACELDIGVDIEDGSWISDRVALKFSGGEDGKIYHVALSYSKTDYPDWGEPYFGYEVDDEVNAVKDMASAKEEGVYTFIVGPGESREFKVDGSNFDQSWNQGDKRTIHVKVTMEAAPAVGTDSINPYKVNLGEEFTIPATATGDVWCAFTFDRKSNAGLNEIKIESESAVDYYKTEMYYTGEWVKVATPVSIGADNKLQSLSDDSQFGDDVSATVYFLVKGSGERKLKVSENIPLYDYRNPGEIEALSEDGTKTVNVTCNDTKIAADELKWFKYTNTGDWEQYLVVTNTADCAGVNVTTYASPSATPVAATYGEASTPKAVVKVEAGASVFFKAQSVAGKCGFTLSLFDEDSDAGMHPDKPISNYDSLTSTNNTATLTGFKDSQNTYYSYRVGDVGTTEVTVNYSGTAIVTITNSTSGISVTIAGGTAKLAVESYDSLLIAVRPNNNTSCALTFSFGAAAVKPEPVAATYEVILNGLPELSGVELGLYKAVWSSFTPVNGDGGQHIKATTATVDGKDIATFENLLIPEGETYYVCVVSAAATEGYALTGECVLTSVTTTNQTVTKSLIYTAIVDYNITVLLGEGVTADKLANVYPIINGEYGEEFGDSATQTLTVAGIAGNMLTFGGVPQHYCIPSVKVSETGGNVTVTMVKGDGTAIGGTDVDNVRAEKTDMYTLYLGEAVDNVATGDTLINNTEQIGYYKFIAKRNGTYTFSLADGDAGRIYSFEVGKGNEAGGVKILTEGVQTSLANGVVLGSSGHLRPFNKITVTLKANDRVVFGYESSVTTASSTTVTTTAVYEKAFDAVLGDNSIELSGGKGTAYFTAEAGSYKIDVTTADVGTFTVNGKELNNGETFTVETSSVVTIVFTGEMPKIDFTISVVEEEGGR